MYECFILFFFFLFFCFSNTFCQSPYPTSTQPGGQADTTRPAESHWLHFGFPHGRRRGVTEVDGPSQLYSGLEFIPNLACFWQLTWTCTTLCNMIHLVFCHLVETNTAVLHPTVHKLSCQRPTSVRTVAILPSIMSSFPELPLAAFGSTWERFEEMPTHFLKIQRLCGSRLQLFLSSDDHYYCRF